MSLVEEDDMIPQFPNLASDDGDKSYLMSWNIKTVVIAVIFLGMCGLLYYKYCNKKDNKDSI